MAVKDILKGVGNVVGKGILAEGHGVASGAAAIVGSGKFLGDKAVDFGKTYGKKMFRETNEGLIKYKIKKRYAMGIAGGALAFEGLREGNRTANRSDLGEISSGELANTVSPSRSPTLYSTLDELESYNLEDPAQARASEKRQKQLGLDNYGATGDLVFAMHNLR